MRTGFIDWTNDHLNLYIFEKQGSRYNLIDRQSVGIEGSLDPASLKMLDTGGIADFYVSIPMDLLTLREQSFPFSDKDKIRDTISYELEGLLLGDVNGYSIDHFVIETLDSGSRVLAVCLEKTRLQEIIDMFSAEGIDPKIITSLDLTLCGGRSEELIEGVSADTEIRASSAANEMASPAINLRQEEHAYTGDIERLKKSLRFTVSLALIFLLTLGCITVLKLISAKKEHESLTKELQAIYRNVFPEDKKIIDVERQFKGNFHILEKKKAQLGGIPVLDILDTFAVYKNVSYTLYEFNADKNNLIIKGTARSFKDVEALKDDLSSKFRDVKVADSGATADKRINFTIVMRDKSV